MKPETFGSITLYNADCMDVMREMPDNAFDLAIVDPPYGKKPMRDGSPSETVKRTFGRGSDAWDIKPEQDYFDEILRVSKNQIIWGGNYFYENLKSTNCFIVWDKNKTISAYADCEFAWTSFNLPARIFKYTWNGMIQEDMKNKEIRIHPTQKPVALYKWLLGNYAQSGDKILDTHLGSGSICIACDDLGFEMTGIELDPDYYQAARKRLINHQAQQKLF